MKMKYFAQYLALLHKDSGLLFQEQFEVRGCVVCLDTFRKVWLLNVRCCPFVRTIIHHVIAGMALNGWRCITWPTTVEGLAQ